MKKIITVMLIIGALTSVSKASTVTTTDGQNYTVSNDSGYAVNMTLDQIQQKISQYSASSQRDQIALLADQETEDVWGSVGQMASVAAMTYADTHVNWDAVSAMLANGQNWQDVKASMSGINWTDVQLINGLSGVNWVNTSGINWSMWPSFESQGQNWEQFINSNGQ